MYIQALMQDWMFKGLSSQATSNKNRIIFSCLNLPDFSNLAAQLSTYLSIIVPIIYHLSIIYLTV